MDGVIFLSDILLSIIALIWLTVATVQDIKKREVANWLSFSFIIIALITRAIAAIVSLEVTYFLLGIAAMILFFGIANLFYYSRIFAGGDAKLLTAIGTAFATSPIFTPLIKTNLSSILVYPIKIPFLGVFILNMLFIGSVYGLFFSIFFALRNFKSFRKEFIRLNKNYLKYTTLCLLIGIILLLIDKIWLLIGSYITLLSALLILFPFIFTFIKSVENCCMIKTIRTSEVTEGDWLFKEVKIGKKIIAPKWEGLTKEEVDFLRKKAKKVTIKQGIPFVPVFLIAFITSLFVNILELLLTLFI